MPSLITCVAVRHAGSSAGAKSCQQRPGPLANIVHGWLGGSTWDLRVSGQRDTLGMRATTSAVARFSTTPHRVASAPPGLWRVSTPRRSTVRTWYVAGRTRSWSAVASPVRWPTGRGRGRVVPCREVDVAPHLATRHHHPPHSVVWRETTRARYSVKKGFPPGPCLLPSPLGAAARS